MPTWTLITIFVLWSILLIVMIYAWIKTKTLPFQLSDYELFARAFSRKGRKR